MLSCNVVIVVNVNHVLHIVTKHPSRQRNLLPFSSIHVDIFEPLASPPLAYNYCLIAVDNHSRYPFAIPLKLVTAKTACDSLIDILLHTSLPTTISSDNGWGSVFANKLNQEFLKRLNVSPILLHRGMHQLMHGLNAILDHWKVWSIERCTNTHISGPKYCQWYYGSFVKHHVRLQVMPRYLTLGNCRNGRTRMVEWGIIATRLDSIPSRLPHRVTKQLEYCTRISGRNV